MLKDLLALLIAQAAHAGWLGGLVQLDIFWYHTTDDEGSIERACRNARNAHRTARKVEETRDRILAQYGEDAMDALNRLLLEDVTNIEKKER